MKTHALFLVLVCTCATAQTRALVSVDTLPFAKEPVEIDVAKAILPSGMKIGGPFPKALAPDDGRGPNALCTDNRLGSMAYYSTTRIVGGDHPFVDQTELAGNTGAIQVKKATRTPVGIVLEASGITIWGQRRADRVVLWAATDDGVNDRATFYGCSIREEHVLLAGGKLSFSSSPSDAANAEAGMNGRKVPLPWPGLAYSAFGSVSRSSSDASALLTITLRVE